MITGITAREQLSTPFVRLLNFCYKHISRCIAYHPWLVIIFTLIFAITASSKLPFIRIENDIQDFTPYSARARTEYQLYQSYFTGKGEPTIIFVFITPKSGDSVMTLGALRESVVVLDTILDDIALTDSINNRSYPFSKFCDEFCNSNEPIRQVYNGLLIKSTENSTDIPISLKYPKSSIFGREFYLDMNFFGVKIRQPYDTNVAPTEPANYGENERLHSEAPIDVDMEMLSVPLVAMLFRASAPSGVAKADVERYEQKIIDYFKNDFTGEWIDVTVVSMNFVTSEVVRGGLTITPFLIIGFLIMCCFTSVTISIGSLMTNQMNFRKVLLAIFVCICPLMATGTALGIISWCGMRFGVLLTVVPLLVLAIGVDDSFLMINAWHKITAKNDDSTGSDDIVKQIEALLITVGPSISITTITNVLSFCVGIATPTPEIKLFSIGGALALTVDFVFQVTFFVAVLIIITGHPSEATSDIISVENNQKASKQWIKNPFHVKPVIAHTSRCLHRIVEKYCDFLCSIPTNVATCLFIVIFWVISIKCILSMNVDVQAKTLFSDDSTMIKVLDLREQYIYPDYTSIFVLVNNPGNINDKDQREEILVMVREFESLPQSVGPWSTKLWLRDYLDFKAATDSNDIDAGRSDVRTSDLSRSLRRPYEIKEDDTDEILEFLEWPEYRHWKGFIRFDNTTDGKRKLSRFTFITAFHGRNEWSLRANALNTWRAIADKHPNLNVSIYDDEAKFLDVIETVVPQTLQNFVITLCSMIIVCTFFMNNIQIIIIASISIFSICIGVTAALSLMSFNLDPIVMACLIMSIGFSVDIPAHITYHYASAPFSSVNDRLKYIMTDVAFPILQASFSTVFCVISLVKCHHPMAKVFLSTVVLVVGLSLLHGLLFIPVLLNISTKLFNNSTVRKLLRISDHQKNLPPL